MNIDKTLICPKCGGTHFTIKREATYLYTYKLDTSSTEELSEEDEALPFLFDYREQLKNNEYLECSKCKAKYPCNLENGNPRVRLTILQKAIRSDHVTIPDFLG